MGDLGRVDGTVLVIGEALIDAVEHVGEHAGEGRDAAPPAEHVGGSPANVAFGLGRLGHLVELATWVGQDDRGARIAAAAWDRWVRLTPGSTGAAATSVARAFVAPSGTATYKFDLDWQVPPIADVAIFSHVHTGSIAAVLEPGGTQVVDTVRLAREAGATVSYDVNARPTIMGSAAAVVDRVEELVALADVVKASDEDVEWLYPGRSLPDVLRHWRSLSPGVAVITRGGEGAVVALSEPGSVTAFAPVPAQVVDTVGAGDSFMAGLLSGLLDAALLGHVGSRARLLAADVDTPRPAVERALRAGSLTVRRAGAFAPTRANLAADL